ncbi:MAG: hypothetical protein AB7P34_04760 [Vicinamibacterales bacterium]
MLRCLGAVVLVMSVGAAVPAGAGAQGAADGDRVMAAVRAAMAAALPFPDADPSESVPANNSPVPLWMVRPLQPGERSIEVMANPLNPVNQANATRAMGQIDAAILAAQRRAELQYERALAEAKRTGRSQDVDGVGLSDEGVAGARIDAEAHVGIDVDFNQPSYAYSVTSSIAPASSRVAAVAGAVGVITVPSNTFRIKAGERTEERYCSAETIVFLGGLNPPAVRESGEHAFEVWAAASAAPAASTVRSLAVRLRGNQELIADILAKTDWNRVQELLK